MKREKLEKVEELFRQMGLRPVHGIDNERVAEEAVRPWKDLIDDVQYELGDIQAVLWAVDQLAPEQRDLRISSEEAASRVQRMVILGCNLVDRLREEIESKYSAIVSAKADDKQSAA